MYDTIVVPTDGSEHAVRAAEHAGALADLFDAAVHAVHVVDIGALSVSSGYNHPTEVIDRLRAQGERATEAIAERGREAGVHVVTEVREGYSSKDLLKYAETNDVDLIAMGTAGRTGIERYLLGSTTAQMIRRAEVPVVAVNARER